MSDIRITADVSRQIFSREDIAQIVGALNDVLPKRTLCERIRDGIARACRRLRCR